MTKLGVSLKPGVYRADATVSLATRGSGPVTVVLQWFLGDAQGVYAIPDGTDTIVVQAGAPTTVVRSHTFPRGRGCYAGVRVTTRPAAAGAAASDSQPLVRCTDLEPPR